MVSTQLQKIEKLLVKSCKSCFMPIIGESKTLSHYFGNPWMIDGESWPVILDKPAEFILQLDLSNIPDKAQALIGHGLLQFFYQPNNDNFDFEDTSHLSIVRVVDPFQQKGNFYPNINHSNKAVYIQNWKELKDYPHLEEYEEIGIDDSIEELLSEGNHCYEDINETLFSFQGDKLLGWPFWTQAIDYPIDSYGDKMEFLFQIDAGTFYDGPQLPAHAPGIFAGDGTGHIFISKNNPGELTFKWDSA